ncbi:glycine cleavage system protein R [Parashewanella tropica]|uniref:glycine cleavage system protein R n=1 Tax=Parashewanella tropica TaxID=2547970 RepID=UPI00105A8201|nr:ACT domain-containing protein [Parashewanella tropica]
MTNYLVLTAMGADRPGIVSRLARLATDCDCDIVDSRMAIFGNEFTMIMMLSGSWTSIAKIESTIPSLSVELDLLTVVKRTSKHTLTNFTSRLEVVFSGADQRGTMAAITRFLADKELDLASVKSHAESDEDDKHTQQIQVIINVPEGISADAVTPEIEQFALKLGLESSIKQLTKIIQE